MRLRVLRVLVSPLAALAALVRWPHDAWAAHRAARRLRVLASSPLHTGF
jgi:hypothetical protein